MKEQQTTEERFPLLASLAAPHSGDIEREAHDALREIGRLREALGGEIGLVQLLTARSDLRHDRDAILSNHRHKEALAVLGESQ